MVEALRDTGAEQRQRPPFFIRNVLVAHAIAFAAGRMLDDGLTSDGRNLLYKLVVKACRGERVSIGRELPHVYQGANFKIEVDGQNNIPSSGPTVIIGNHVRGGPLVSNGRFLETAKQGYDARFDVQEEEIREPFVIMQKGLGGWIGRRYGTGIFYNIAANSLDCEIVAIPRFGKYKDKKEFEVINNQRLRSITFQRIAAGGAALWLPPGDR